MSSAQDGLKDDNRLGWNRSSYLIGDR